MPTVLIIGNASPTFDARPHVERADYIVRFNGCAGLHQQYGSRTHRVYLCNTGSVARRFIRDPEIINRLTSTGTEEIVFSYPRIPISRLAYCTLIGKRGTAIDRTLQLGQVLNQSGQRWSRLPQSVFDTAVQRIKTTPGFTEFRRRAPVWAPSSGCLALMHIAHDPLFADHEIHVLGFGFNGWEGHPWFAERAFAETLQRAGRLRFMDR